MAGSTMARRERTAQAVILVAGLLLVLLAVSRPANAQDEVPGGGVLTRTPSSAALGAEVTVQSVTPCPAPSAEMTASASYQNPIVVVTITRSSQNGAIFSDIVDLPSAAGPWTATVKLEQGVGDYPPGSYQVDATCAAYYLSPPCTTTGCLARTDSTTDYYRYDPQPFELCSSGQTSCAPPATTTSTTAGTTSTTAGSSTSTTAGSVTSTSSAATSSTGVASASAGAPGSSVTVSADGFTPGSTGDVLFASTPVKIGTFTADARGAVALSVTIPSTAAAGPHHVILRGTAPGGAVREVSIPITVTSTGLAKTGRGLDLTLMAGLTFMGLGFITMGRSLVRGSPIR